ncbi:50S ribosomal protein L11 methyltransferase [Halosquirtibacter laminarini]|uniref:50S ribosomal protein L11 methyltransferase n=1 Tax=Halosquirtibacter laminarini TaxID=3374600 RepID=A0AC61NPD3_9BACT|nr:50S ribosomal protein L11 methyltransferase [Prolixibacteraceae bacterium]
MKYIKTVCTITPDNSVNRDLLTAALGEIGYDSFVSEEEVFEAYVQSDLFDVSLVENGSLDFAPLYTVETQSEEVPDQNWNQVWEQESFTEMVIADQILIRAVGPASDSDYPYQIEIVPNMSFGTGDHETTATILEQLIALDCADKTILDMGCGTGILGIMTAKRGAKHVDAIDIDAWCFDSTTQNSEINGVNQVIRPILGDATAIPEDALYEVVLANIHKNILLQDMPKYASVQITGGLLYMSGFFVEDVQDIRLKAESLGYVYRDTYENQGWAVVLLEKQ